PLYLPKISSRKSRLIAIRRLMTKSVQGVGLRLSILATIAFLIPIAGCGAKAPILTVERAPASGASLTTDRLFACEEWGDPQPVVSELLDGYALSPSYDPGLHPNGKSKRVKGGIKHT